MKNLVLFQLMISFILGGCANLNKDVEINHHDVHEALIRYILDTGFDSLDKTEHLFISLDGADPKEGLLERFSNIEPAIYPVSDSKSAPDTSLVTHRVKGGSAAIIQIRSMKVIHRNKVKVDWGHYKANLNSSGSIATLKFKNGIWLVTKSRMKWIS